MRVDNVEAFVVEQRLQRPFSFSQWEYASRMICLVRVTAENGVYGWGEAYGPATVAAAGVRTLAPLVIGQNALREGAVWRALHRRALDYARSGTLMASVSAVDVALHDLKGKLLGVPVAELLGGRRRDSVRVYATGMYFTADAPGEPSLAQRLASEAAAYVRDGFHAVKMKVGHTPASDREHVAAVRDAIGPDVELMIDANHAYDRKEAAALCRDLEPMNIAWFEEPLSPEDYVGYVELRRRTHIPIAAGECEYLVPGFRRLFEAGAVDIAQPDVCAAGGLTEAAQIAALARAFHVNVTPHCWGSGIAFAAALHWSATLDAVPGRMRERELPLEMDRSENPLRDRLVQPAFVPVNGRVVVPLSPGLGVDVDLDALREWTRKDQ